MSFSSRIPVAFPTGDANSLSKNILMYACTLTEREGSMAGEQGRNVPYVTHSASASVGLGSSALGSASNSPPGISPAVMMVSKHVDGSLNQVTNCSREPPPTPHRRVCPAVFNCSFSQLRSKC